MNLDVNALMMALVSIFLYGFVAGRDPEVLLGSERLDRKVWPGNRVIDEAKFGLDHIWA